MSIKLYVRELESENKYYIMRINYLVRGLGQVNKDIRKLNISLRFDKFRGMSFTSLIDEPKNELECQIVSNILRWRTRSAKELYLLLKENLENEKNKNLAYKNLIYKELKIGIEIVKENTTEFFEKYERKIDTFFEVK
ncbi:hypothetical protein HS141_11390 [Cetobacterium somerae]|uniref:hypothetical protein n=1 Tax=Cetobacterium somerae TaxID=188913 RepID=UPI00211E97E1|nr:hypothetical protein [Cetobacterium somerae]MCQ9627531.1 hypothetical protein [Cetobacterium somerae]